MSCELCEKNKNIVYGEWGSQMWLEDNELWFASSGFVSWNMKINYCPFCGRKLNEDNKNG